MPARAPILVAILLALAVLASYSPVFHQQFISYDDGGYVAQNPHVRAGLTLRGLHWAFTSGELSNWHPLTWLSHMADWQLYGPWAGGHKLTSLLLHAANAILLFTLLLRMTGALRRSALVAALFALHPLHVQSVAWVAERKDVLSTLFGLLALLAYVSYARRPAIHRYLLVALLMALSLLAKPMLVTLPVLLLLLDFWPLRRWNPTGAGLALSFRSSNQTSQIKNQKSLPHLILEKLPLFLLSIASSIVTFKVQNAAGAVQGTDWIPLRARIANALVAYAAYLRETAWPTRLVFFDPLPDAWPAWAVAGSAALLLGITIAALALGRRRPYLPVGWFWYLGTLVPVIGLVQVGGQAMADRYTYFPLIGIFIMLAWAVPDAWVTRPAPRRIIGAAAVALLLACGTWTAVQVGYWQDDRTLFGHAARVAPDNFMANVNYGGILAQSGQPREALIYFERAVHSRPRYVRALAGYAWCLAAVDRLDEAITQYRLALRLDPGAPNVHLNLSAALEARGQPDEALSELWAAYLANPHDATILTALADHLLTRKQFDQAAVILQQLVSLDPRSAAAHAKLGATYSQLGRANEAAEEFRQAATLGPKSVDLYRQQAGALLSAGRLDEATQAIAAAVALAPGRADLHTLLGQFLAQGRHFDDAERELTEALRLDPHMTVAQQTLDQIRAARGKGDG